MCRLRQDNSPSGVFSWAEKAIEASDLTSEEQDMLLKEAVEVIAKGRWRGDVCDRWRELGYGPEKIKDFYP